MLDMLGGALGSAIGGWFGYKGQKSANETNMKLSREQMAFQERMSSTAYQRAVGDMQSAGLNPMLAYSQGGASSPVGSMPQVQNAAAAGMSSASSGAAVLQALQGIMQSGAMTEQIQAATAKIKSETLDQQLHSARLAADIDATRAREGQTRSTTPTLEDYLDRFRTETRLGSARVADTIASERVKRIEGDRASATFAEDVARRKAESQLTQFGLPAAAAEAEFWRKMESAPKEVKFLLDLLQQVFGIRNSIRNPVGR